MKKLLALALLIPALAFGASAYNIRFGNPDSYIAWTAAAAGLSISATVLTNANDGVAHCFTVPAADTITHIGYHQGTTVGAGASYTATLETTTTAGAPSGTRVGGTTATTFNPTGSGGANDNTWQWISLGANTYTVTQGLEACLVIRRTTASDATTMGVNGQFTSGKTGWPIALTAAAGAWTKTATLPVPVLGMKSATEVYGRPWTGTTYMTVSNFGNTTETGTTFTIPSTMCATAKVRGVVAVIRSPVTSATDTYVMTLYSSPASSPVRVAQSSTIIADRFNASSGSFRELEFYFATSATLTCGTEYGIGFATTTATNAGIYYIDVASAADWDAWDFKQQMAFATRTASSYAGILAGTATGDFTKTTTRRLWLDLLLEDITVPTGSTGFMRMR